MSIRLVATLDCPATGVDQVGLLMGKDRPKIENERAASNSSHDGGVTGSHRVAVKAVEWPSVCLMSLGDSLAFQVQSTIAPPSPEIAPSRRPFGLI